MIGKKFLDHFLLSHTFNVCLLFATLIFLVSTNVSAQQTNRAPFEYIDYVATGTVAGAVGHARFESTQPGLEFEGHQTSVNLLRLDELHTPNVAIGLGVGYLHQEYDTSFNAGETKSDGVSIAPRVNFNPFGDNTNLSLGGDFALFWNHSTRANNTIMGDYVSTVVNGIVSLNHREAFAIEFNKQVFLEGGIDYTQLWFNSDSYQETDGTFVTSENIQRGTLSVSGKTGFSQYDPVSDRVFGLFGLARYNWDVAESGGNVPPNAATLRRDGLEVGGGIQAKFGQAMFASVQGTTTVISQDYKVDTISGTIGFQF